MIENIQLALQQPFFLRSLLVAVVLMLAFPLYGNLVVIRKEANIAHTFSHIGLLGVAVGLWFQRPIERAILGSVGLTVVFLSLVGSADRSSRVAHNEIGAQLGLVGAILLVSQMTGYKADINSYLFGDILLLGQQDVILVICISIIALLLYRRCGRSRYALSLHQSLAQSKQIPVRFFSLLYLIALGLILGGAMKIIGVLLVSAFLILPSNIAKTLAANKTQRNLLAIGLGVLLTTLALFLSRHRNLPSGASIVGIMIIIYLLLAIIKR